MLKRGLKLLNSTGFLHHDGKLYKLNALVLRLVEYDVPALSVGQFAAATAAAAAAATAAAAAAEAAAADVCLCACLFVCLCQCLCLCMGLCLCLYLCLYLCLCLCQCKSLVLCHVPLLHMLKHGLKLLNSTEFLHHDGKLYKLNALPVPC